LQGPRPPANAPAEAQAAWRSPETLLLEIEAQGAGQVDPRVTILQAERLIALGDGPGAAALLGPVAGPPEVNALLAHAGALAGAPRDAVRDQLTAAVARAPDDPAVQAAAAAFWADLAEPELALEHALSAARITGRTPEPWDRVVQYALAAGDLRTATDAARRASDLDPTNASRAALWSDLAYGLADKAQTEEAWRRSGQIGAPGSSPTWPPSVEDRMALLPEGTLAILEHASEVVEEAPALLALRAKLRIEAGRLDEAAHDGLLLAERHGDPDGWALAFAATVGRQRWTRVEEALEQVDSPLARQARLEHHLITSPAPPGAAAADHPRGRALSEWLADPKAAAAADPQWAGRRTPSVRPPPGYTPSPTLSPPGIAGFVNAAGSALVFVGTDAAGTVSGTLPVPPPLGRVFTIRPRSAEHLGSSARRVQLAGGILPLWAAARPGAAGSGIAEVWCYAFTAAEAERALALTSPSEAGASRRP
jgi:tetratricopeptide (TPR) repeat protein